MQYTSKIQERVVRLTPLEIEAIKSTFQESFHKEDHIWLFGSRVDPDKKGGDIDLYIETHQYSDIVFQERRAFKIALQERIGEQKIDVVIKNPELNLYIYEVARKEGVL